MSASQSSPAQLDDHEPPLSAPLKLSFDYTRSVGSVLSQFFTALRSRHIVGVRGSDGKVYVPPVEYDPVTATALGLAASFASGVKANFGTMTKPLHVGHCSRNGAMAALLAREGFTASADAFEHRQGFFEVFNGAGDYDADAVLRDWADPFDIVTPGIARTRSRNAS